MNGIDSKILELSCKDYLIAAITNSKKLREKISFIEQVKLTEHIMNMNYSEVVSAIFFEGEELTTEQIRDYESKFKKHMKYGAATIAGGGAGRIIHHKNVQGGYNKLSRQATAANIKAGFKGTVKSQAFAANAAAKKAAYKGGAKTTKILGGALKSGKLRVAGPGGRGAAIAVGLYYMYRKLSDPCVRKSLSIENISNRKLAKHQCQAEACKKVISNLNSDKNKCNGAANPEECLVRMESEIKKWKKRYQKELVTIAKIRSQTAKKSKTL